MINHLCIHKFCYKVKIFFFFLFSATQFHPCMLTTCSSLGLSELSRTWLQREIELISSWSQDNHLKIITMLRPSTWIFPEEKGELITCAYLFLDGNRLDLVSVYKLLGIVVHNRLSWSAHVKHICASVRRLLGFILRLFSLFDLTTVLRLYRSLVLPLHGLLLLYDPYLLKHIKLLESVKAFACKIATRKWNFSMISSELYITCHLYLLEDLSLKLMLFSV